MGFAVVGTKPPGPRRVDLLLRPPGVHAGAPARSRRRRHKHALVTAVAARFSEPRHLATVGVLLVGAAVGALAGYDPKLAIAAAIGMAFVLIAIGDLAVGIAIFGVLTFLELSPVAGGPAVSFAKVAGLTLAISWLAALSR